MGSRPEVNMFILHMTSANEQKWSKRNEKRHIVNAEFGPFAWCNRKQGSTEQQLEAQLEAYAELIRYVAKVSFLVWQINSRIHNILLVDLYYVYRNRKRKIRIGFWKINYQGYRLRCHYQSTRNLFRTLPILHRPSSRPSHCGVPFLSKIEKI